MIDPANTVTIGTLEELEAQAELLERLGAGDQIQDIRLRTHLSSLGRTGWQSITELSVTGFPTEYGYMTLDYRKLVRDGVNLEATSGYTALVYYILPIKVVSDYKIHAIQHTVSGFRVPISAICPVTLACQTDTLQLVVVPGWLK